MKLAVTRSRLSGAIAVPGSKSHTIRGIVAGLLSSGTVTLLAPLSSADTRSALEAAKRLGAKVTVLPDRWQITGTGGKCADPGTGLDLGNSGTGLRMLAGAAALQDFPVSFDGDESLRSRGMAGLLEALARLGVKSSSRNGKCPLTLQGPLHGGHTTVDGATSQFLTSLLFALPLAEGDSVIELDRLFEQPYIGITESWLKSMQLQYSRTPDLLHWEIPGNQSAGSFTRIIAADFSTAAFPLVAGTLCGDGITICNLDFSDPQGDKKVFAMLEKMGAVLRYGKELEVLPDHPLHGADLDLNETPDALPVLAVAGCFASGVTRLVNVPQARLKETDRIACMASELGKMGAKITELPDGLVIESSRLHGAAVDSHGDHRIAMALAVAGMNADGETVIDRAESASVTYPDFISDFARLGAVLSEK